MIYIVAICVAALCGLLYWRQKRKREMAEYGLRYWDDRNEQQDFLGRKSFLFAVVSITPSNLSGSVQCPVAAGEIKVIKSHDINFWVDTSTFKKFDVKVEGRRVVWDCALIQGATITSPSVKLLCLVEA